MHVNVWLCMREYLKFPKKKSQSKTSSVFLHIFITSHKKKKKKTKTYQNLYQFSLAHTLSPSISQKKHYFMKWKKKLVIKRRLKSYKRRANKIETFKITRTHTRTLFYFLASFGWNSSTLNLINNGSESVSSLSLESERAGLKRCVQMRWRERRKKYVIKLAMKRDRVRARNVSEVNW